MAGKKRMRLTDAAIDRLRPGEREYTVWDSLFPGLGVRVRPSGGRSYVLLLDVGGRSKRLSLGSVLSRSIAEVRRECHARKANPEPEETAVPERAVPLFREFVEGEWKKVRFDRYKPWTQRGVRYALKGRLLPAFGPRPWIASPRHRSGAGSMRSAGPPQAMPTMRSPSSGKS